MNILNQLIAQTKAQITPTIQMQQVELPLTQGVKPLLVQKVLTDKGSIEDFEPCQNNLANDFQSISQYMQVGSKRIEELRREYIQTKDKEQREYIVKQANELKEVENWLVEYKTNLISEADINKDKVI